MKVVVGISGASGASLGLKFVRALAPEIQKHVIVSEHAQIVLDKEENTTVHTNNEIWASVASGSYGADAMIIVPCSMNTLAKIACGIADNLITRAASVMIKERRTLVLAPREIPFSPIALENMHKLSQMGVIIAPPVLAYYSGQESLDEMENFMIGKWCDLMNIENNLYKRWSDHA
ncbi:MAG TPA: UbiX family flavin prenyltransferase [Sulfuricurvum sp.]|nr:MAG: 3-octaprenyl-4-hydroxybenzoate carboxy-lyase [Campylobacterales bacterium 16-40-21]OZA03735.1 MAG: 3-octaprenyl-4-hydroxybenzoate carboxy-lyase [Sulfuricurvum sp. 17-40-25]HQS65750.1 UbiX family flavin prenyltransferase [Sulfuricurvum sp.]HQT36407.1 UbiX family flavin prenyltransferase [Sulfuricurvum sp.]